MKQNKAAEFVEENLKTIFAYALSRLSDKDEAEDLTNDIVLAILQSADKIRNENAFYGYVWAIAANTYRKYMRKKQRDCLGEIDETVSDGSDFIEEMFAREEVLKLRREIALLSKEYRECTVAYYYDGLSCAEVSKKLGISLEMVKYYLFKTRKILKEGISMEREFGEKSFKPAAFDFVTIFSGAHNSEYHNLFSRKLPGQILMAAYYVPMTVRELAIELGVASVYLEDEIRVLERYGLIVKTPGGKYQTNLVIFTDDFTKEFHTRAEKIARPALAGIVSGVKGVLGQIRNLNGISAQLSDSRLLWALLWPIMRKGSWQFETKHPQLQEKAMLYDGATGTNFGISNDEPDAKVQFGPFAGYTGIDDHYYASAADFGILPETNRYFDLDRAVIRDKIYKTVFGQMQPEFLILNETEENRLFEVLAEPIAMMAELYEQLFACACQVMHMHAPAGVGEQIDRIVLQTLLFRTFGLIGDCAVGNGALALPDFDGPAAMYVRENTQAAQAAVNQDVLM